MLKRLMRHPRLQAWLAALLGRYLDFALRSTRWTVHGQEYLDTEAARRPVVAAFWHERLPLMPAMWQHVHAASGGRARAYVLVSRHKDGRFIGEIVRRYHVQVVHGSSQRAGQDRGGAAGALAQRDGLRAGGHAVITPVGPRGPRRLAAPGVAQLAAISGARVLPCAAQTSRHRVLPSWDRMVLPLPWGRGVIVCGEPIAVPRDGAEAALPGIAAALTAATDRADALCR